MEGDDGDRVSDGPCLAAQDQGQASCIPRPFPTFESVAVIEAPLSRVVLFHTSTDALQRLTPPITPLQIFRQEPLDQGSITEFRLWLGPVPVRWVARHQEVELPCRFSDVQVEGPFKSWLHVHEFIPKRGNRTVVLDRIWFQHRPGFGGAVTRVLFSKRALQLAFAYRAWVLNARLRKA